MSNYDQNIYDFNEWDDLKGDLIFLDVETAFSFFKLQTKQILLFAVEESQLILDIPIEEV